MTWQSVNFFSSSNFFVCYFLVPSNTSLPIPLFPRPHILFPFNFIGTRLRLSIINVYIMKQKYLFDVLESSLQTRRCLLLLLQPLFSSKFVLIVWVHSIHPIKKFGDSFCYLLFLVRCHRKNLGLHFYFATFCQPLSLIVQSCCR